MVYTFSKINNCGLGACGGRLKLGRQKKKDGKIMGTFVDIILNILAILAIIVLGSFIVVFVSELILKIIGGGKSNKSNEKVEENSVVKGDDIVVYSNKDNPNNALFEEPSQKELIDGDEIQEIDYEKAIQEQQMLEKRNTTNRQTVSAPRTPAEPKKVESTPDVEESFWDTDDDDEFTGILDSVIEEAKKTDGVVKEETTKASEKSDVLDDATKKELEELRVLKEQQQKELDEFKQLKEDFAREKEEQLALYKENLDKTKQEELEKLRREAIAEQEKLEAMRLELEKEQERLAKEKEEQETVVKEETVTETVVTPEPIVKETIIRDEEELNRLKYKNLVRMNNRLTRIIRNTEKLSSQKAKNLEKAKAQKEKLLEKERLERIKEQERRIEAEAQERIARERENILREQELARAEEQKRIEEERLAKKQAEIEKRNEITRKLNEASKKAGKYKLDSKIVKINKVSETTKASEPIEERVVEEHISTTTSTSIIGGEKAPMKASAKPTFEKEYYEHKLIELEEELRDAEKELRANKTEYIPLTRIHKAYARDGEKLRKKELQVAKQKVALYGVKSSKVDPEKKAKLDENLQTLAELKDSVAHCEDVIRKNKDRYPVLEKNYNLLNKQILRINDDIKVCNKAIEYYNKRK